MKAYRPKELATSPPTPPRAMQLDRFVDRADALTVKACKRDFKALPMASCSAPYRCDDDALNRYYDILPYEHSRVVLAAPGGATPDDTYINASHIAPHFANDLVHFISACAPTAKALSAFWRMVWEQRVQVIVCLARETEKGYKKVHFHVLIFFPNIFRCRHST
jgi:protein tyrosine phosphatase